MCNAKCVAIVQTPEYCALGKGEVHCINAWIGPPGTVTPLHTDPHHNLLCQVAGVKRICLYAPSETPNLYPFKAGLTTNSSRIDVRAPDLDRYPRFAGAKGLECCLKEGLVLYIPPGWWHHVEAMTASVSVSFWWS
jgi:ribosomal protein L16 Arg81 hydroxylase